METVLLTQNEGGFINETEKNRFCCADCVLHFIVPLL